MEYQVINRHGERLDDDWGHLTPITADALLSLQGDAASVLMLDGDTDLAALTPHLKDVERIGITFGHFADGRGFSIARALREDGFDGHLRAMGHIMPDQFRHAMAVGFDDIALPVDLAARYGLAAWRDTASHILPDYQSRLQAKS